MAPRAAHAEQGGGVGGGGKGQGQGRGRRRHCPRPGARRDRVAWGRPVPVPILWRCSRLLGHGCWPAGTWVLGPWDRRLSFFPAPCWSRSRRPLMACSKRTSTPAPSVSLSPWPARSERPPQWPSPVQPVQPAPPPLLPAPPPQHAAWDAHTLALGRGAAWAPTTHLPPPPHRPSRP